MVVEECLRRQRFTIYIKWQSSESIETWAKKNFIHKIIPKVDRPVQEIFFSLAASALALAVPQIDALDW